VPRLLIFNEHKQVLTDTRYLKHLEIMNDPLAERYYNIIKEKVKEFLTAFIVLLVLYRNRELL